MFVCGLDLVHGCARFGGRQVHRRINTYTQPHPNSHLCHQVRRTPCHDVLPQRHLPAPPTVIVCTFHPSTSRLPSYLPSLFTHPVHPFTTANPRMPASISLDFNAGLPWERYVVCLLIETTRQTPLLPPSRQEKKSLCLGTDQDVITNDNLWGNTYKPSRKRLSHYILDDLLL